MDLHHGVHALMAAHNGVGGTGVDAQGATYAPLLVYPRHGSLRLYAVSFI
jgi:hypothetical protein